MALPKFLQSSLWSYDLNSLDIEENKELIITQVLNFGSDKQMEWLFKNYSIKDFKKVVSEPDRGIWLEEALNYWTKILGIKLKDWVYRLAIKNIDPYSGQAELFYKYVLQGS